MPFVTPDFKGTRCLGIAACGTLDTDDAGILELIEQHNDQTMFASYQADGGEAILRVGLGGHDERHVHLDAFRRELLPGKIEGKELPPPELTAILDRFAGQTIGGRAYGRFILPMEGLPRQGIIASTLFDWEAENVSIGLSDAQFEIKGAPVSSLSWSLFDDRKRIMIDIEGVLAETIADDYLVNQLTLIDSAFRVFVLGEGRHGRA